MQLNTETQATRSTPARDELIGSWFPQKGPQYWLCACPCPEIFFGGARGGGKTDGVLGKWAKKEKVYGRHFNAIMFRPTTVSAEDAIERSKEIYEPLGAKFNEQRLRWRMPNGGRVSFAYLENVNDAKQYQGRNVTDAWVEEAGQYPIPDPVDLLFGVLRSAHGVPVQLILTGNPGGPGQHWLRDRYQLFPFPKTPKWLSRTLPDGTTHNVGVIPSRITDNKILLSQDPGYISRLHLVGDAALVKAWLEGDWSAIEGAFFDCWSEGQHVLTPFRIPTDWLRFRSADWGSRSPFSIGWYAVVQDDFEPGRAADDGADQAGAGSDESQLSTGPGSDDTEDVVRRSDDDDDEPREWLAVSPEDGKLKRKRRPRTGGGSYLPRGAIVKYAEDYGASAPGKGLKLTAEKVAERIIKRETGNAKIGYGVLDPSAFIEDGGPSIAERINTALVKEELAPFRKADNKRVPRVGNRDRSGPMSGWDQMRGRLIGTAQMRDDGSVDWATGRPMLYVFSGCKDTIRTLPTLQHDPNRAEDLDTKSEDHAADETRYACMSRPWLKTPLEPEEVSEAYRPLEKELKDSIKLL